MRRAATVSAVLLAAVLGACRSTPETHFYTLGAGAPGASVSTAAPAYSVVVGPATVPEIVDRPQIVVRLGDNEVMLAEQARWAEPLEKAIPRVIAGEVAALLEGAVVAAYPQHTQAAADYRVLLDVQRFDAVPGDAVTLELLWSVRAAQDPSGRSGRVQAREEVTGPGYGALVAAHERALATASRAIAAAIRALRP